MGIKQLVAFTGVILVLSGIALAALPFVWPNMVLRWITEAPGGRNLDVAPLFVVPVGSGLIMVVIGSTLLTVTLILARNKG